MARKVLFTLVLLGLLFVASSAQEYADDPNAPQPWSYLFEDVLDIDTALTAFSVAPSSSFRNQCGDSAATEITVTAFTGDVDSVVGFGICSQTGAVEFYGGQYANGIWQHRRWTNLTPPSLATADDPADFSEEIAGGEWTIINPEGVFLLFPLPMQTGFVPLEGYAWRIVENFESEIFTSGSVYEASCRPESVDYTDDITISLRAVENIRTRVAAVAKIVNHPDDCWLLYAPFLNVHTHENPLRLEDGDFVYFDTGQYIGLYMVGTANTLAIVEFFAPTALADMHAYTYGETLATVFDSTVCANAGICARELADGAVEVWVVPERVQEEYDYSLYDNRGFTLEYLESLNTPTIAPSLVPPVAITATPQ